MPHEEPTVPVSKHASKTLTPEERSMRARLAAHARWGNTPEALRRKQTEPARQAQLVPFLAEVDRDHPGLPERERQRLASSKLAAHMIRLRFQQSKQSRERKAA